MNFPYTRRSTTVVMVAVKPIFRCQRHYPSAPTKVRDGMQDLRVMHYGFLLVENFSLIALGSAIDPLRIANMIVGRRVYDYRLIGPGCDFVSSSDGIRVVRDVSMADSEAFDVVFVVGPNPIPKKGIGAVLDWLRRQAGKGAALGGLDPRIQRVDLTFEFSRSRSPTRVVPITAPRRDGTRACPVRLRCEQAYRFLH